MEKTISPARQKVIATTEGYLGRSLSPKENKIIRGLAEGVVEIIVEESRSGKEIVDLLNSIGGDDSPVMLFETLAESLAKLAEDRQKLMKFHSAKARTCLAAFDFDSAIEQFSHWLLGLLIAHRPASTIRALKFGLFEAEGACRVYVAGTKAYDEHSSGWASSAPDWWDERHVAPKGLFASIWPRLNRAGAEPWVAAQAITIVLIKQFFARYMAEFQNASGLRQVYVVTGFDDGDLYTLRTYVSPAP